MESVSGFLIVFLIIFVIIILNLLSVIFFIAHGGSGNPWNTLIYRVNLLKLNSATLPYKEKSRNTSYPNKVSMAFRTIAGLLVGLVLVFMYAKCFYIVFLLLLLTAFVFVVIWILERKPK